MKKSIIILFLAASICLFKVPQLISHCEIPCGIYNDFLRIKLINEHCQTISKSMESITILSANNNKTANDFNQLIRWVKNKDDHASKIQEIVTQYFMTQRIKPDQNQYLKKLSVLHKILIMAMKCKQTNDLQYPKEIVTAINDFWKLYEIKRKK